MIVYTLILPILYILIVCCSSNEEQKQKKKIYYIMKDSTEFIIISKCKIEISPDFTYIVSKKNKNFYIYNISCKTNNIKELMGELNNIYILMPIKSFF
jgi:uncharacterized protein YcfL